jgi:hypothetical protein
VAHTAQADLVVNVQREAAEFAALAVAAAVATRVLAAVLERLAVSGTIYGAGSSWASFGLSLVGAIVPDYLVDWVVGWFYDPEAEITGRVERALDDVSRLLTEGDDRGVGLRAQLSDLSRRRAELRQQALRSLILDGTP